jgi:hypothetical protein
MTNVEELIFALDVIKELPEFANTTFIAKLNWKQVPEAYTKKKSIILNGHRLTNYTLKETSVVDISDIGLFQIAFI